MLSPRRQSTARPAISDDFRRMILLMETAAVLESRAARAGTPAQALVLRRRAEQRLREAESIRSQLAAAGAALPADGGGSRMSRRLGSFTIAPSSP